MTTYIIVSMLKAKVLVVGPQNCGKSCVANFLADDSSSTVGNADEEYKPTAGVRILEFERKLDSTSKGKSSRWSGESKANGKKKKISVELWDCSGHQQYEACWPAMMQDAKAVVLMYNPENRGHEREIELWHEWFVQKANIDDHRCLVFAHYSSGKNSDRKRPPKALQKCTVVNSSFNSVGILRDEFDKFLATLLR